MKSIVILSGIFIVLISPALTQAASKSSFVKQGNKFYIDGDYTTAIEKYTQALEQDSESDIINFNLGTAMYKSENYGQAITHLQKALLGEKEELQQKVSYNLGNALYKEGISHEQEDIKTAIQYLENALEQYESVLAIDGDEEDRDVKYNYEFVKEELERLKKKQQEQKQDQDQDQDQQQDQQQENEDKEKQNQKDSQEKSQDQQDSKNEDQDQKEEEEQKNEQQDSQQEKQNQEEQQNEEEQEPENSQQNEGNGGEENEDEVQDREYQDEGSLTPKEAQMILENYEQNEQPKRLLNVFQKQRGDWRPVGKDW
ncbi:hypothetical protein MNBD_UNCLBAC01-390 [hydrothermal vent metagenome]|uniref:Uncharacterized protein n=1 Tax=hydrothermal vent metagenome TaxID=652676 RepID=A0A3B1DMF2_9ZZZZ